MKSNKYIHGRILHIISWCCYLILLTIFLSSSSSFGAAFKTSIQILAFHAILFYFNTQILIPKLLEKQKYLLYVSSIIILVIVAMGGMYLQRIYMMPNNDAFKDMLALHQSQMPEMLRRAGGKGQKDSVLLTRSIMRNFSSVAVIILLSIVYKTTFHKILEEKRQVSLRNENLLSEMKFLKSQVNPHFLFNALNNVYTLVLLKKDQAPAMLMKLSEMLRYMLYECNDERVSIGKEIDYINNYIELQHLKTEKKQNISIDFQGVDNSTFIPPLLLIPFIENSFKHSRIENTKMGWIKINIKASDTNIHFRISNSIPLAIITKDETGGIGLENVKRRLELMYPDKHKLNINKSSKEFLVTLDIFTP